MEALRQRQEQPQTQLDQQIPAIAELRVSAEALLQTALVHQQNFERLISEFNRHRYDGHGA